MEEEFLNGLYGLVRGTIWAAIRKAAMCLFSRMRDTIA